MPIIINTPNNNGLMGYWSLDEGSGDTAYDYSGNKNHGKLVNSPVWTDGVLGKALMFNGSPNSVNLPTKPSLVPTTSITISLWVYRSRIKTREFFIGKSTSGVTANTSFWIEASSTDAIAFYLSKDGTTDKVLTGAISKIKNIKEWSHIVGTWDGNVQKLYLNSLLDTTTSSWTGSINSIDTFFAIGRLGGYTASYFSGIIDEVRIYNRALSQSEITQLYQSGASKLLSPTNLGLVGYWSFDEGSGDTAYDYSGNNNHGKLVNSPVWTGGVLGKALSFNGSNNYVRIPYNPKLATSIFTFSAWFFPLNESVMFFANRSVTSDGWSIRISGSSLLIKLSNTNLATGYFPSFNLWQHLCVIYNGNTVLFYVNGSLSYSSTTGGFVPNPSSEIFIGGELLSTTYYKGGIDEVRIYNRDLSQSEITQLYQSGLSKLYSFSPDSLTGLMLWLKADAIQGLTDGDAMSVWKDSSKNNRDATSTGAETTRPLYKTNILNRKPIVRFDGSNDQLNFTSTSLSNFTLFICYKITSKQGYGGPITWKEAGQPGFSYASDESTPTLNTPNMIIWDGTTETTQNKGPITDSVPNSNFLIEDWDSSAIFFRNNANQTPIVDAVGGVANGSNIGHANPGGNNVGCDIAEIIVYNSILNTENKLKVRNYLNEKYAIY